MKKADVKVGGIYLAKVSERLTGVRVDGFSSFGGYDCTNIVTGRKVFFRSAQRFRKELRGPGEPIDPAYTGGKDGSNG